MTVSLEAAVAAVDAVAAAVDAVAAAAQGGGDWTGEAVLQTKVAPVGKVLVEAEAEVEAAAEAAEEGAVVMVLDVVPVAH